MQKYGIDVSSHNGNIQWDKVKTDFVILRAGWSWYAGGMNIDVKFLDNVRGVEEAGIPWGVYLYAYDKSTSAAIVAANRLADLLQEYKMEYPVWYDIEDTQYTKMNKSTNTQITKAFIQTMQSRGFYTGLYTYTNFANGYLNMNELTEYDFWVADYRASVGYKGSYSMWQNNAKGTMTGISTVVDTNICYKDYPAIIKSASMNGFTASSGDSSELLTELESVKKECAELKLLVDELQSKINNARSILS